ncbi:DUF2746 domain-containing protein [Streptomyces massasporeus]|uniref:DUF2746 domain-containing protein n=1 Tax=Streptomyces massasporeus TaxID=67324 RepID=UPI00365BAD87
MSPSYEPSGWFGLAGYIVIGVVVVLVAAIGGWSTLRGSKALRQVSGDVGAVRSQVENDHDSNMRDDLDRAIRLMESNAATTKLISEQIGEVHRHLTAHGRDIGGLRTEIGGLRGELRDERDDRREDRRELERLIDEIGK